MATMSVSSVSHVERIGEVAGTLWRLLSDNGPLTMAKLVKGSGEQRDLVMQAIGWLAREGKLEIELGKKGVRNLYLRPQ